jgi:hypothetical protein
MKIIFEAKREPPMIRVRLLKRRRRKVKVDPKLGGQWKVKEKTLFTSSIFPPTTFTHTFNFSF